MSQSEQKETYTTNHHRVVCPYCDEFNDMSETVRSKGEGVTERECGDCNRTFDVYVHYTISVTATARIP